jgi:hypothetical protein
MAAKIRCYGEGAPGNVIYGWHCPGCGFTHEVEVPRWTWNRSTDKPTFYPSVVVFKNDPERRCHFWIREGVIEFLSDCYHKFKSKRVTMSDIDAD